MPVTQSWSGKSHEAAAAMFKRADRDAAKFSGYANGVAAALRGGAESIGSARSALLAKAEQLDTGPLNVTDQWVVLIDPAYMSADELAKLQELAMEEQGVVNRMLSAVGDADEATANAVSSAGKEFGFVEPGPPKTGLDLIVPSAQRPTDQVPDPRTPIGVIGQEAIRSADEQQNIREITKSTNEHGEELTTVIKQDGSKSVLKRMNPFDWPSKQNFYQIEEYDKNGDFVARTSSWHSAGNDCDYTSITYADNSNLTMSMDSSGHRTVGFTTAEGHHSQVPVDLIDRMSTSTGAAMSGLEKHIGRGGSLPMVTAESVENIGKNLKWGGPALTAATTVFDMAMAESGKDRCIALVAGVAGGGGGWGAAEFGAWVGAFGGPVAPVTVPAGALAFGLVGGFGGSKLGQFIGEVVCPS
ncbi:hypothetical protein LTT02_13275 [Mycolicibacterium smegmatis]|nr:hypothetical protein [Mycolicibacterium smegmatis]MDF1902002.1 hypothetical protein [Mycolicibacterium smegmatis]MDF1908267.1 hypothetical protein [Mycolicibacterium smegmatis]MDF1920858.1 hypothetical protein [Mycolicibacterium smegmatis]MDF1926874.1 hypothetical protein [Mycolicibacterium smegmatis]UGT78662.1 hypothetical protein LTT02_13275 [Mycolicibacterium smegmatis]